MSSAVGTSDEVDRVRRSLSTGAPAWCSYYGVTCNSNSTSATYASVTHCAPTSGKSVILFEYACALPMTTAQCFIMYCMDVDVTHI